jgi:subfamily B ATP-binding cassette protein MsbA
VVVVGKKVRKAGAQEEEEAGNINVTMHEAFAGIRLVKSNSREDYEIARFKGANTKMLRFTMKWTQALEAVSQMVEVVASLGIAAALLYVWYYQMNTSKFISLNLALAMMYPSAKALSRVPLLMQKCLASTTKIFEAMDRPVSVQDKPDAIQLPKKAGRIIFQDINFHYEKERPALTDFNLTIEPGERVALVGPSGAGKSTVFSLLLRLYDPVTGRVEVNGVDLKDVTQNSLRDRIGVVSQDVFLFHDTIYENIRYGRLDATEAEIIEAAKRAHAHDFITAHHEGYNRVIGDKGVTLSGGQQQRLAIARAFLRNAPILMLDEATSALDGESERLIQSDLEELSKGRTVIAIAHRLSTIRNSDKIVVMQNGTVSDIGNHEQLLRTSELYQHLHNLQHAESFAPAI